MLNAFAFPLRRTVRENHSLMKTAGPDTPFIGQSPSGLLRELFRLHIHQHERFVGHGQEQIGGVLAQHGTIASSEQQRLAGDPDKRGIEVGQSQSVPRQPALVLDTVTRGGRPESSGKILLPEV